MEPWPSVRGSGTRDEDDEGEADAEGSGHPFPIAVHQPQPQQQRLPASASSSTSASSSSSTSTAAAEPRWGWPARRTGPFPLACRFVPTDQWFRTHVDPRWTVRQTKAHLLSKCTTPPDRPAQVSKASMPPANGTGIGKRSIKLSLRPFRRDKVALGGGLGMSSLQVPAVKVEAMGSAVEGTALGPQDSAERRTLRKPRSSVWQEDGCMLFSFCNGHVLNDDLPLWQTLVRPYDLLELQYPKSYVSLDRGPRYLEPYFRGTVELFADREDESEIDQEESRSVSVVLRYGMMMLSSGRDGGKQPGLVLNLNALYILEEVVLPLSPSSKPSSPPYYIRAVFRVPVPEKVWSSQHFSGQMYNFLLPDETSHDHLLRILALYWRSNTKASSPLSLSSHHLHNSSRLKTYRRALLRDAVYLRQADPGDADGEGAGPLDVEDDPGSESEREWEGWRDVYDSQGLLRSRKSAGVLRETVVSLERTRTR